ncbi:LD-carboxypeptidase, partial [Staphylococcus pseudintermedius]
MAVRITPFLDDEAVRQPPQSVIGYPELTPLHFPRFELGITPFYGPACLADFAADVALHLYAVTALSAAIGGTRSVCDIAAADEVGLVGLCWEEVKLYIG